MFVTGQKRLVRMKTKGNVIANVNIANGDTYHTLHFLPASAQLKPQNIFRLSSSLGIEFSGAFPASSFFSASSSYKS
jgi:hypothetical protein